MRMSEKCRKHNKNNFDNPLTSRRTDGGKNKCMEHFYRQLIRVWIREHRQAAAAGRMYVSMGSN